MSDLIAQLEQAVDGLLYPSETDAPVEVFVWHEGVPFSIEELLVHCGYDPDTSVETTDLDSFFRPVTTLHEWHGPEEQERVQRFSALRDLLQAELSDIEVYRVGSITIDVYVVGRDWYGNHLGIATHVVET